MKYHPLGNSGLLVSEMTLGTITFGGAAGFEKIGNLDVKQAKRIVDVAIDGGVNLIDTANIYSSGQSEEVLGEALGTKRHDILVATKARSRVGNGPNDSGASRVHVVKALEDSLRRLKTDYVDLYQIHNWDGVTPVEETVEVMDALVRAGKIRYWGTSNYTGWQMMKTIAAAKALGVTPPVSQQINYTPENRDAEYEMMPLALDQGFGTLVWGPLGEGLLTGAVRRGEKASPDRRQGSGWPEPYVHDMERAYRIIDTLAEVADARGVSIAQVCLAWLLQRPGVTSLIVGARTSDQFKDTLKATDLQLSTSDIEKIEGSSRQAPRYPYWHRITADMDRVDGAEATYLQEHRKTIS